jgi:hypothetical protein
MDRQQRNAPEAAMAVITKEAAEFGADDDTWTAQWIVLDAGVQAARLRRQASAQTAAICEAAEREAAKIQRQASMQAAAIRDAAEREAAQLQAIVATLSAGSGDLVRLDGDVASQEAARLPGEPGTRTAGRPPTEPEAKPGTQRKTEPGTPAARRPQAPPRQLVAARVAAAATAGLFLFALIAGTAEVALHGFAFFTFRSSGTGETGRNGGLQEDQGPGQPDAPKPSASHVEVRPSPLGSVAGGNG